METIFSIFGNIYKFVQDLQSPWEKEDGNFTLVTKNQTILPGNFRILGTDYEEFAVLFWYTSSDEGIQK